MAELLPEVSPLEILEQRQLVERLQTDHVSDKVRPEGTCRAQVPVSPRFCSCPGSFDLSLPHRPSASHCHAQTRSHKSKTMRGDLFYNKSCCRHPQTHSG